jgi:SAM-dependent methyltransferase
MPASSSGASAACEAKTRLKIKADWQPYLRGLRRREIEFIFGRCPHDAFPHALELGAGDGFQSTLLARYAGRLVATDFRPQITRRSACPNITFATCDAERVDEQFAPASFDLIFSSNMMEHLPNPARALAGMRLVLRDDGIAAHVIPSPFWKFCHLAGFYPDAVLARLNRFQQRRNAQHAGSAAGAEEWDNNPKSDARARPYLARLLWPAAHGASGSNLAEFRLFSERYWRQQFESAGFLVAAVLPGPVSSGYGFGWDSARAGFERLGFASEYAYITVKAGQAGNAVPRLSCLVP